MCEDPQLADPEETIEQLIEKINRFFDRVNAGDRSSSYSSRGNKNAYNTLQVLLNGAECLSYTGEWATRTDVKNYGVLKEFVITIVEHVYGSDNQDQELDQELDQDASHWSSDNDQVIQTVYFELSPQIVSQSNLVPVEHFYLHLHKGFITFKNTKVLPHYYSSNDLEQLRSGNILSKSSGDDHDSIFKYGNERHKSFIVKIDQHGKLFQ